MKDNDSFILRWDLLRGLWHYGSKGICENIREYVVKAKKHSRKIINPLIIKIVLTLWENGNGEAFVH